MKLGDYIREYRESHFLSQRQFAQRCNLSNAQISLLEKGVGASGEPFTPSYKTISKVARGMGITTATLMQECGDFTIDITDDALLETPSVQKFMEEISKRSPDEEMLVQAYRMIPAEHRIEAMQAVFNIKAKYEA